MIWTQGFDGRRVRIATKLIPILLEAYKIIYPPLRGRW